jgi:FAD/FMN-containing dehydrogenase
MVDTAPIRGAFRGDERARAAYAEGAGIYRIVPEAIAVPADVADLQALVRWAAAGGVALVPRGAGSGMGGGNVGRGVVVDLTGIAPRRLEIDPARQTAWTSAGVTAHELDKAARAAGLRFPPIPSSGRFATLGGMVATNAAGAASVRCGSVREWVRALRWVAADGGESTGQRVGGSAGQRVSPSASSVPSVSSASSAGPPARLPVGWPALERRLRHAEPLIRERFPRVRKNSSGYALDAFLDSGDPLDLLIGSEGTLGIVTAIEWRLEPVPGAEAGLRLALRSLDDLADVVAALLALRPSALELLDRTFLSLVATHRGAEALPPIARGPEALLLVEFERSDERAARGAVGDAVRAVKAWTTEVETALTPEESEALWAVRHAASPILASLPAQWRSLQVIEDGCVPVSRIADYIRLVRRAAAERGIEAVLFGHAGDGNIHVNLLPEIDRAGWQEAVAAVLAEVTMGVIRLGGTPSGEHGDGRLRAPALLELYGAEIVDLFRAVKDTFDPGGILNPGVKLGDGPPLADLKVGDGAAPLPADIASALREIERTGDYGRRRLDLA